MTEAQVQERYFDWLVKMVNDGAGAGRYSLLLGKLHCTEFYYSLPMDGNRYEDGVALRYRFGHENGIDEHVIATDLDQKPCSVLEMMVALSDACSMNITDDEPSKWFWIMIRNLGLSYMTNENFREDVADYILHRMLNREYNYDGCGGGLFVIRNPRCDLRGVDIWYQLNWYLSENLEVYGQ